MTQARRRWRRRRGVAAAWYDAQGYEVVDRNWRCREGEIDLIVRPQRELVVVCEVKTRSTAAFGAPAEAVTHAKRQRLRHLAAKWLDGDAPFRPREIRFDVACILGGDLDVIEGAF